jgi:hypothetical protein
VGKDLHRVCKQGAEAPKGGRGAMQDMIYIGSVSKPMGVPCETIYIGFAYEALMSPRGARVKRFT